MQDDRRADARDSIPVVVRAASAEMSGTDDVRVSVAMATFNGARHLRAQLDSMVRQSMVPDELVVSDDGSTDETVEILDAFGATAPFAIRILRGEGRLGVTGNFERAIAACTGAFIILADQDDEWMPDRVERSIAALETSPEAGYAFSDARIMNEDGSLQSDTLWTRIGLGDHRRRRYRSGEQVPTLLNGPNFIYGMAMTIRRAFLADVLPIAAHSPSCTHDTWTALTMSGSGHDGVMIDACLVCYRQHAAQVVGAGGARATTAAAVGRSLRSRRVFDPLFPDDLDLVADRIAGRSGTVVGRLRDADRIRAKATHLRVRERAASLPTTQRFILVAREYFSGRYHDYSASWKTAVRDMLS